MTILAIFQLYLWQKWVWSGICEGLLHYYYISKLKIEKVQEWALWRPISLFFVSQKVENRNRFRLGFLKVYFTIFVSHKVENRNGSRVGFVKFYFTLILHVPPPLFSFWNITVLWSNTTQIVITHICAIYLGIFVLPETSACDINKAKYFI